MKTLKYIFIFVALLTLGCSDKATQTAEEKETLPNYDGEIKISGAYALTPLVQLWIKEYRKIHPSVVIKSSAIGTGEVITENILGNNDLVMVSSELPESLETAAWILPVARLSVVMIVNKKNPYWSQIMKTGIKPDDLTQLFNGEIAFWGDLFGEPGKHPVSVYYRSDKAGATDIISKYLWLDDQTMKGTGIDGETKLIDAVKNDPLAISYCNFIYSFNPESKDFIDDLKIIPLDLNQNGILDAKENFYENFTKLQRAMYLGKYPCILNRPLQFVATQEPATKELYDFLIWVITEGQDFISEKGYMELRPSEIKRCLAFVEN